MISSDLEKYMTESPRENVLQKWAEIESNGPQSSTNVLKFGDLPIKEFGNGLNHTAKKASNSSKGLIRIIEDERSVSILGHDPVGSHLIQLRKYALVLEELIEDAQAYLSDCQEENEERPSLSEIQNLQQMPDIPPFPEAYPFVDSLGKSSEDSSKMILTYEICPPKNVVDGQRKLFVERVLMQVGYYTVEEKQILQYLSDFAEKFLENVVCILRHYKNSSAFLSSENLMKPLEVTLHAIGYGGIKGLHNFYYQNFIKKHDVLLQKCETLRNEYKQLLHELQNIAETSSDEESSEDEIEEVTSSGSLEEHNPDEESSGSDNEDVDKEEKVTSEESMHKDTSEEEDQTIV